MPSSCLKLGLPLLSVLLAAPPTFANIFYRDDRVSVVPTPGEPLSRIGTLQNSRSTGRGTAFLVSACHILTNRHVAFADTHPLLPLESSFQLTSGASTKAVPVAQGKYMGADFSKDVEEDWALLRLESCLGREFGWLHLRPHGINTFRTKIELKMAGYPVDRITEALTVEPHCQILGASWEHDCASRPGNSGSPIFMTETDGAFEVVAIHSRSHGDFQEIIRNFTPYISNGAVPVAVFYEHIFRIIENDL